MECISVALHFDHGTCHWPSLARTLQLTRKGSGDRVGDSDILDTSA